VGVGLWLLAAILALARRPRAAAIVNGSLALAFGSAEVLAIISLLHQAGNRSLWFGAAALLTLAAGAVVLGWLSVKTKRWLLWPAWIFNFPAILILVYYAFWFHIF
jgi:hypothetical protein